MRSARNVLLVTAGAVAAAALYASRRAAAPDTRGNGHPGRTGDLRRRIARAREHLRRA